MPATMRDNLVKIVRKHGFVRSRDLVTHGIPRTYLARLLETGVLERPSRGVYVLADNEPTENHSLAEACKRVPHAIVCLLSALRFHNLTTQAPYEVWLGIDRKARLPKVDRPRLRVVRFSGSAMVDGIEKHVVEGVQVRVTTPARTAVDCFAYRNKVGLDVALEALRDCWRQKKVTMEQLHHAAQARRMGNVMRPYLESVV